MEGSYSTDRNSGSENFSEITDLPIMHFEKFISSDTVQCMINAYTT